MLNPQIRVLLLAGFAVMGSATAAAAAADPALVSAVASPARSAAAVARDKARHPVEELTFFGLNPSMNVVELWPGGGYWTDILGPYLKASGHYTIALPAPGMQKRTRVRLGFAPRSPAKRTGSASFTRPLWAPATSTSRRPAQRIWC